MTIEEIIAISDFLGDDITEDQFWRLADEARKLDLGKVSIEEYILIRRSFRAGWLSKEQST